MKDRGQELKRGILLKHSRKRLANLILKDRKASKAHFPETGGRVYMRDDGRLVFEEMWPYERKYYVWLQHLLLGDRRYLDKLKRGVEEDIAAEKPTRRNHRIARDRELLRKIRQFKKGHMSGLKGFERNYRRMLTTSFSPSYEHERGSIGTHIANFHMHSSGTSFTKADFGFSMECNKGELLISYRFRKGGKRLHYASVHYFCGGKPKRLATFHSWKELFL